MPQSRSRVVVLVALVIVCALGVWSTRRSSVRPESQAPKVSALPASTLKMVELQKKPAHMPLSSRDIKGALKMPRSCRHPVMEVRFENGAALMGVSCQDGSVAYRETLNVGLVDTSVPTYDARGASFAMVLSDQESIQLSSSGLPAAEQQGVMVEVPIPNTCTHGGADIRFGPGTTTVRYSCLDGQVVYGKTIEMSLNLVDGPGLNKDRSAIIAMVLRDPEYVARAK